MTEVTECMAEMRFELGSLGCFEIPILLPSCPPGVEFRIPDEN
jgi:hypothetical protein